MSFPVYRFPTAPFGEEPFAPSGQRSLFPLAPCGHELSLTVLDHPCPGVVKALTLIEPTYFFNEGASATFCLHCLAVTEDRAFVAKTRTNFSLADIQSLEEFWLRVGAEIARRRAHSEPMRSDWSFAVPDDCLASFLDLRSWNSRPGGDPIHPVARSVARSSGSSTCATLEERLEIETKAQQQLEIQLAAGVWQVLEMFDANLASIIRLRPRLSLSIILRLVALAAARGPQAVGYVFQALKTESIAVLDLAASESLDPQGLEIGSTICEGRSLPSALAGLGINKAIHRRSVRCDTPQARASTFGDGLNDFPISGRNFLSAIPLATLLPFDSWPHDDEDYYQFFSLVGALHNLEISHEIASRVLRWCISSGYEECRFRLILLLEHASAISAAAQDLAGIYLGMAQIFSSALSVVQRRAPQGIPVSALRNLLDPDDIGRVVLEIARVTAITAGEMTKGVFKKHPGLPSGFGWKPYIVRPLITLDQVIEHGLACNVCMQDPATVINYVAEGAALYAVNWWTGASLGTFALCLDDSPVPKVIVWEIAGLNNAALSPVLEALAQALAESFREENVACWMAYQSQCAQFRRLAGAKK